MNRSWFRHFYHSARPEPQTLNKYQICTSLLKISQQSHLLHYWGRRAGECFDLKNLIMNLSFSFGDTGSAPPTPPSTPGVWAGGAPLTKHSSKPPPSNLESPWAEPEQRLMVGPASYHHVGNRKESNTLPLEIKETRLEGTQTKIGSQNRSGSSRDRLPSSQESQRKAPPQPNKQAHVSF